MSLPYENATSGDRALGDMQKLLRRFGCNKFGSMVDDEAGETRMRKSRTEHERQALDIASVAVYSILRDWIKGQITAVETGILSFEGAFLGQILLPNGRTVLEHAERQNLLEAPADA